MVRLPLIVEVIPWSMRRIGRKLYDASPYDKGLPVASSRGMILLCVYARTVLRAR